MAEVDGQVAGFAQLGPTPGRIELEHLWVRPAFMRRGIGRALLQRAVREASRLGHMALQIDADPYAEPFYLACGARRCGELPAPIRGDSRRVRPQLVLSLAAT